MRYHLRCQEPLLAFSGHWRATATIATTDDGADAAHDAAVSAP